jgi:hypothetical protein
MTDNPGFPNEPPAGWYLDPSSKNLLRWWDGTRWTEPTRPIPRQRATPMRPQLSSQSYGFLPTRELPEFRELVATPPEFRQLPRHGERARRSRIGNSASAADSSNSIESQMPSSKANPQGAYSTILGLSAMFAISLLLLVCGYTLDNGVVCLAGLVGALFFGVGTTPTQLSSQAHLDLRLGIAGILGLSVPLLAASVMVLTPLWYPVPAALILGVFTFSVHIVACRRAWLHVGEGEIRRLMSRCCSAALEASTVFIALGTLLWCVAALTLGHIVPGILGFLPKISPIWYVGLLLILVGIVLGLPKSELYAGIGAISLVAALTLTPALAYGTPRVTAATKHIDLVQLILQVHHLHRLAGIYQAYSGFFSGVAWISNLAGIHDTVGIAAYWPFLIGLFTIAELRFFFGRLSSSRYKIWAAIIIAIIVNAIGTDYFSPQSVGFTLSLGVFGLAVGRAWPGLHERARILILIFAGCSMAITHELSPYIAGGVLVVLVLFRTIRPWYLPATILLPTIIWALLNMPVLAGFISLTDLGSLSNFTPPKQASTPGLQRLPVVAESSDALAIALLILVIIAGIGFLKTIRDKSAWAYMFSVAVGLILTAVNPYGNEGIFRAALFGIPWLAVMAMRILPETPPRLFSVAYGFLIAGLTGTHLIASFGLDNGNVIPPAALQAMNIYQASTLPDSYILDLSYGDVPFSFTFPAEPSHEVQWANILTLEQKKSNHPNVSAADSLARNYHKYSEENGGSTTELYAIWSPASVAYSVDYGLEAPNQAHAWLAAIKSSPDWQIIYSSNGTYLFRVVMHPQADASKGT